MKEEEENPAKNAFFTFFKSTKNTDADEEKIISNLEDTKEKKESQCNICSVICKKNCDLEQHMNELHNGKKQIKPKKSTKDDNMFEIL